MNSFEEILYFLQGEMPRPQAYGWFHVLWIFLALIIIVLLYEKKNKYSESKLKIILGVYGIVAAILEILKQLIWTFNYDSITNTVLWDYEWYAFPFQLCTTPIFVCLLSLFLKQSKFRNHLLSYISYFTILGSISTILIPSSCFTSDILVNIHTMWLHVGSFVVSIYLLMSGVVNVDIQSFKNALLVFLFFVGIAEFLNIFVYNMDVLNGETFNMFYISPYFISSLPVFDVIQKNVPYLIYLIIYISSLVFGGFIIYLISYKIKNNEP